MHKTKKNTKKTGDLGEKIAVKHLMMTDFTILDTNYWKKWGELDIVAQKGKTVHFIEVKSVSYETKEKLDYAVSHETWRPEEQVHQFKLHQIKKALETWIMDKSYDGEWQIDIISVRMVPSERYATVKYIKNIIVG